MRKRAILTNNQRSCVRVTLPAPRRRGLRIVRDDVFLFKVSVISHSLRLSSSPNRTRYAGLRFGFLIDRKCSHLPVRSVSVSGGLFSFLCPICPGTPSDTYSAGILLPVQAYPGSVCRLRRAIIPSAAPGTTSQLKPAASRAESMAQEEQSSSM